MNNEVHVTKIGDEYVDVYAPFTVRGRHKGGKAKPTKCRYCGDEINIGEQYFRLWDTTHVCLGCATYE